jgi:hypothetical protein
MQKRRALQDTLPPPPRLPQNPDASLQNYRLSVRSASGIADRCRCHTSPKEVLPIGISCATKAGILLPAVRLDNLQLGYDPAALSEDTVQ